jgi:hypothetical protein
MDFLYLHIYSLNEGNLVAQNRPAEHLDFHHLMPPTGTEGMYHNTSELIHGIALQHHQRYR